MDNKLIIKINTKRIYYFNIILSILIISSFMIIIGNPNEFSQEYQLIIDSQDEIYEGNNFSISVYTIQNNTPYYQIDTTIFFKNNSYYLTYDKPEIIIKAPEVTEDTYLKITANKSGYISDEKYINIINIENRSQLIITLLDSDFIVDGNTYFSILITDEKGNPISNTTIGIQSIISKESIAYTDENGRVRILAPNDRSEIIILAQKIGYINATEKVWININPDLIEKILKNPYTIILFSFILLFFSIFIVNIKKIRIKNKKSHNKNHKKINNLYKKNIKNNRETHKIKESKVEEIRINKKEPDKKIVTLKNKNKEKNIDFRENKKIRIQNYFEGIDEIRYKIDKLTGDFNSINENRWFEGHEKIGDIIDEKLKKNKKKKFD